MDQRAENLVRGENNTEFNTENAMSRRVQRVKINSDTRSEVSTH